MWDEQQYLDDERAGMQDEGKKPWFKPLGMGILQQLQYMMDEWGMSEHDAAILLSCFTNTMRYVGDVRYAE